MDVHIHAITYLFSLYNLHLFFLILSTCVVNLITLHLYCLPCAPLPSLGHLAKSRDAFGFHNWQGESYWYPVGRGWEPAEHVII